MTSNISGSEENNPRSGCKYPGVVSVCPMRGSCLDKSKIYKVEVTTARETNIIMVKLFKNRFYGHQSDLHNQVRAESTTLSKFVRMERGNGK
jgi:hypothetical protein